MLRKIGLFVVIACSAAGTAAAQQVAMLTQVTGEVRVSGTEGARGAGWLRSS